MKNIRLIGLIIFMACFGLFLSLGFIGKYELSEAQFDKQIKAEHVALKERVEHMFGQEYGSNFAFIADFQEAFDAYNQDKRNAQLWNEVIYDNYVASLTKSATKGLVKDYAGVLFGLIFIGGTIGALMFLIPKAKLDGPAGIKHNGIFKDPLNNRGWLGILIGTVLIVFYITIYFYDQYMTNWVILVEPLKQLLVPGGEASQWFLYGFLYTFGVLVMGVRMIIKYRHSKYQIVRTVSVMFFQTAIAFILPEILVRLNQPYFDFKNMWPLDYDFFDAWHVDMLTAEGGGVGIFMFVWGITLFVIGVPVFVYLFGKRWYCSWVCGCGGLAETVGDPFRQLSDKSVKAWKIERYLIHAVLVFAVVMTAGVIYNFITGTNQILGLDTYKYLRQPYGFYVGALFSGVIGTGFYPFMGNRVWCRFGCPLAAYLGLVQRFKSRFRITTNGGQCISCGNCSTYCEQGIDVRWYAQRGQNIVRSSCVGCGVCSSVCPRGVLNLENADEKGRFELNGFVKVD
ncbi:MAG: 4Fe-4S binding protein [Cyclobacteriaceae bacterium]